MVGSTEHPPASAGDLVDVTTTAVGRDTLAVTYRSFLDRVSFSGRFRMLVTIDPAYPLRPGELAATRDFLTRLPQEYPQVAEVVVEELPRQVGLQGALSILFAHTTSRVGVHLEDDWEFTAPVDLDALIADLYEQDCTQIVFGNAHVARGGTFDRPGESQPVPGTRVELVRLTSGSWAANYLPLCPHLHRTDRWVPMVARALALTDGLACPDERVRERVVAEAATRRHRVLWTRSVVARDIGRRWLAARGGHRSLTAAHTARREPEPVTRPPGNPPLRLDRSLAMRARAEAVIPGMTQTYQKRPVNFAEGEYPVYLERGSGTVVWDVDGNAYVDFVLALGAATLGHDHPAVSNTLRERLGRGVLLSLPAPVEVTAAEELAACVPGVEAVRFLKSGAEACAAAVRLARHRTGRDLVLLAGYHGWHDQLAGPSAGVPAVAAGLGRRYALTTDADDERFLDAVRRDGPRAAAVLLSTPYHRILDRAFLRELRHVCDRAGCLLVCDEIVTGFRLAPGGLAEANGIRADLLCLSKGLAAGMPLAAVAGRREVMADFADLRVSTTFGGEMLSLEVMRAALREYRRPGHYDRLVVLGRRLRDGINAHARAAGLGDVLVGYDPMPCLRLAADPATHERRAHRFVAELARRGFLLRRDVNFVSTVHTEGQIDQAVAAAAEALPPLREIR